MSTTEVQRDVLGDLPRRAGKRPATNRPSIPHTQLDQLPDDPVIARLLIERVSRLPSVEQRASIISVPGTRAMWLVDDAGMAPDHVFIRGREFGHVHPDLSLHVVLPRRQAETTISTGWGEWHPWSLDGRAGAWVVLLYAPRNAAEVEVVERIVRCSWQQAISASNRHTRAQRPDIANAGSGHEETQV